MSEFVTLHARENGAEIRIRRDTIVVVQADRDGSTILVVVNPHKHWYLVAESPGDVCGEVTARDPWGGADPCPTR